MVRTVGTLMWRSSNKFQLSPRRNLGGDEQTELRAAGWWIHTWQTAARSCYLATLLPCYSTGLLVISVQSWFAVAVSDFLLSVWQTVAVSISVLHVVLCDAAVSTPVLHVVLRDVGVSISVLHVVLRNVAISMMTVWLCR